MIQKMLYHAASMAIVCPGGGNNASKIYRNEMPILTYPRERITF